MSTAVKILTGKSIHVKSALASERTLTFVSTIYYNRCKLDTFYAQGEVYEALGVTRFYIVFNKIRLRDSNKRCVIFVKDLHPVQQDISKKTEAPFEEIIEKIFMNLAVFKTFVFKRGYHPMD